MVVLRVVVALAGVAAVVATFLSAVRTVVLPRGVPSRLTRVVFLAVRSAYDMRLRHVDSYDRRDRSMATYAPLSLLVLLQTWLLAVYFGFVGLFWAAGGIDLPRALAVSGSSLTTLGFDHPPGLGGDALAVAEAITGLVLLALLITYLPTLYSGFRSRELAVTKLEVRAGAPPSGPTLLWRYAALGRMDRLLELWQEWEQWFADIEESHTSFPALTFFRSPQPDHSWVTAAGAVLDAAALLVSTIDLPPDVDAQLTLRAGSLSLRRICAFFEIPYPADPQRGDPVSVTRQEYDEACARLAEAEVPLRTDRELAWLDFAGWRVNYDATLLALASLTMAPYAPWSSDRSLAPTAWKGQPIRLGRPLRTALARQRAGDDGRRGGRLSDGR